MGRGIRFCKGDCAIHHRKGLLLAALREEMQCFHFIEHHLRLLAQFGSGDLAAGAQLSDDGFGAERVHQLDGRHAQRKEFLDVFEVALALDFTPSLAFDDVARTHRGPVVSQGGLAAASANFTLTIAMAAGMLWSWVLGLGSLGP
jgi:hypothetical protein